MVTLNQNNSITSTDYILTATHAKKLYQMGQNSYLALKGIDIKISREEFIAVVGKSGSGKSTLLNLFGGIDQPTQGSISINGKDITHLTQNKLSQIRGNDIGFIFQFFQLMPTLTVLENVVMPMDFVRKIPASKRRQRAEMLLERVGIIDQANKFPAALSGGEQQRVAIARALANDPIIILADEPTGNLDTQIAEDIFNLLKGLALEGKSVIMVTHNEELAYRCNRIIRIADGLITEDVLKSRESDSYENKFI